MPEYFTDVLLLTPAQFVEMALEIRNTQIANGVEEPEASDTLIYGISGTECLDALEAEGYKLVPANGVTKILPVEMEAANG